MGWDEPESRGPNRPGCCSAARTPRRPRRTYLVSDDCFVVINARVQLPAAELAPPATGDGASPDPAQRAPWQRHLKLAPLFLPVMESGPRTPSTQLWGPPGTARTPELLDTLPASGALHHPSAQTGS